MLRYGLLAALLPLLALGFLATGEEPKPGRIPFTTSKITGTPEPPPAYKAVQVFPNLKFKKPLLLTRGPDNRFFVGEQEGKIFSFRNASDAKAELFLDIRTDIKTMSQTPGATDFESVYALAFHPKFAENRYCYVCYTLKGKVPNLPDGTRISRFTIPKADPPRIDPASEEITFTFLQGGHNGCDIHFGNDGMLYISTGDSTPPNPPDAMKTGQDITDLSSSILRIDVDRKDTATKNHGVPKDNPFVGVMIGDKPARPEVWAYGFRNPWRMSFDRPTGDLWVGDVGWELWEMVHKVQKGGNYGWSITEARQPVDPSQSIGPTPILPPTIEIPHTAGASVTGGYVYRGKKFPELVGHYIFGDWETRRIWGAQFKDGQLIEMPELAKPTVRIVAFGEDNDGELYFLDYDTGTIHTLERNASAGQNSNFPTKLSATGLFASAKDHTVAPGVLPFAINVPMWHDYATAQHFLALPGTTSITDYFEEKRPIPGNVYWHPFRYHFPQDALLMKTITLDGKRLETQVLHFADGYWAGYTYAWRDDQSDADLVPAEGGEKVFTVKDVNFPSGKREHVWQFPSRSQCLQCHNAWPEYTLAFNPEQLNRDVQLTKLMSQGFINRVGKDSKTRPPATDEELKKERILVSDRGTVAERAQSYLHVNCGHCHRFGGGGTTNIDLSMFDQRREMAALDIPPKLGGFGLPNARVISPGYPEQSVLYYRMSKFGKGRMPHIGSDFPDERGLSLVREWIAGKADAGAENATDMSPVSALRLAREIGRGKLEPDARDKLLAKAATNTDPVVRELFTGFLPPDPAGRRLGTNPRPNSILALKGDAKAGESLFFDKELKCAACHRLGDKGQALGPDLTTIGKTRSRAELLDSLLNPSARVEPQFTLFHVTLLDGRSLFGIVTRRDAKEVVLRDAENKEIVLKAGDVESVRPSRQSMMPDGQLAGLRPQQAADLLEFLALRK